MDEGKTPFFDAPTQLDGGRKVPEGKVLPTMFPKVS